MTADGAYDGEPICRATATRQHGPPPDVVIPPRASAAPSTDDADNLNPRDRHIRFIAEKSRMAWQRATGYGRRNLVETAIGRYKHLTRHRRRPSPSLSGPCNSAIGQYQCGSTTTAAEV